MRKLCAAVVAASGIGTAPAGAQEVVLGESARATTVGAAGGWTAWSAFEGGKYELVTRAPDGTVRRAQVGPRAVPFDLDLGIATGGRPVAAYSRCPEEPKLTGGANATAPNFTSGRGCRIAVLDLVAGTERVFSLSKGSESDVLPSVAGDRIAFAARLPKGKAQLRWRTRTNAKPRVLDTGLRRSGSVTVSGGPAGVDTDGTRVAAVWRYQDEEFSTFDSVLRVGTFTGKPRQVAFGVNGEACAYDQVLAPTLTPNRTVTYLETDGAQWLLARTPATRQAPSFGLSRTGEPGVVVTSAAVDGARLVVAETASAGVGRAAGATRIRQLPLGPFARRAPVSFCDGR